tara:strand:- start:111 stop:680 length:570 start_codon:yes stop_codon:yes gene_type:complete
VKTTSAKRIDLSRLVYIAIMLIVLAITLIACEKELPVTTYKTSSQSLEELLNDEFYCYRTQYPDSNTYHFNTSVNNNFLAEWNNSPSEFDLNDDQQMNTLDLLLNLSGFGNPQPDYPSFVDFTPFETFGEGNTWLTYTGSNEDISFGWMHRTPYDEVNKPTYGGYENIYTWTLDVVTEDKIVFYYFVEI